MGWTRNENLLIYFIKQSDGEEVKEGEIVQILTSNKLLMRLPSSLA